MKKRILSAFVLLCMVLTLLPVSALAAEDGAADTATEDTNVSEVTAGDAESLKAAVETATEGATIEIPAGTYNVGNWKITKAISLKGAGAGDTFLKGVVAISGSTPTTEEPAVQVDGDAEATEVIVSGITFQPADDSSVNHGLYFGNYNTDTEMKNWSIAVEDCAFEGWQFAICLQGNSETMSDNTLTVTKCTFDRVFCGASVCAAIGTLDTENSNIEACGPYFYAAQVYGDVENHNYYYFELGGEPLDVTIDNDNGRPAEGFKGFDVVVLNENDRPKSYAGTVSDAIAAAEDGDTIYLPAGEYDIGALNNVTKAVNIRGEGADKTILTGTIIYKNLTDTEETEKVITVEGITLNAPSGENANHQGLCWGAGVSGYTLNVENCAFDGWQYAITANSQVDAGNTLKISDTSFTNTGCSVSVRAGNNVETFENVEFDGYAVQYFNGLYNQEGEVNGYYETYESYAEDKTNGTYTPDISVVGEDAPTVVFTSAQLQEALTNAQNGDTIRLAAGTYTLPENRWAGPVVNLIGAGSDSTIIEDGLWMGGTGGISVDDVSTLTVSGITFRNVDGPGNWSNTGLGLSHISSCAVSVKDCVFEGFQYGVHMNNSSKSTLSFSDVDFVSTFVAMSVQGDTSSIASIENVTVTPGAFAVQVFGGEQNYHYYTVDAFQAADTAGAGDGMASYDNSALTPGVDYEGEGTVKGYFVKSTDELKTAIEKADGQDNLIIVAPGKYDGNITFGGKNLTIKAQYPAYVDGVKETAEDKLSEFTGTFNTYGTDSSSFNADQTVIIDGFALSGDGLKIGNQNYNSVGNLEVRHCTMACGENLTESNANSYAGQNYLVKVNGDPSDQNYASVIVEDNYISGTPVANVFPIQLWDVDHAVVCNNVIELTNAGSHQAIGVSKMAAAAEVEISGNTVSGAGGGIYVTTWLLGGNTKNATAAFTGSITVNNNTLTVPEASTMEPIYVGYEEVENVPYGLLGGSISAVNNTNNGESVEAEIVYGPAGSEQPVVITATFMDGDVVVGTINGTPASGGTSITITLPTLPDRDNYAFQGWSANGTNYEAGQENVSISENTTFNAVWNYTGPSTGGSVTRYTITIEDADHGTVKSSASRASRGSSVTLTVTPDEGYALNSLTVTQSGGGSVSLTDKGDGKYTFTMPRANVTVEAVFAASGEQTSSLPFTDVDAEDWFYDAVTYVYENGMMEGTSATTFAPGMVLSRAMVAQVLYNLEEQPGAADDAGFPDVAAGAWYADAVNWAAEHGVVTGYDTGAFGPEDAVTREQLAVMLYRYAQYKGYDVTAAADLSAYSDANTVSAYAETAMSWAVGEELFQGVGASLLSPNTSASRAEVATILMRFTQNEA